MKISRHRLTSIPIAFFMLSTLSHAGVVPSKELCISQHVNIPMSVKSDIETLNTDSMDEGLSYSTDSIDDLYIAYYLDSLADFYEELEKEEAKNISLIDELLV